MVVRRARMLVWACLLLLLSTPVQAGRPSMSSDAPASLARAEEAITPPARGLESPTAEGTPDTPVSLEVTRRPFRLYHHPPRREKERPAVIMVPGLGFNARLFDLSPEVSLANTLVARGYPVWRFEPDWEAVHASELSLSYLVRTVLPAVLAEVRRHEGERPIVLLGHGTGGTLVAGYLGAGADPGVAGAVLIAPVLSMRYPDRALKQLRADRLEPAPMLEPADLLRQPSPFASGGDYFDLLLTSLGRDRQAALRKRSEVAFAALPTRLASELLQWVHGGSCPAGDLDFFQLLPRIHPPTLLISGIADNIARREDVERAALAIGARDREYRMMSRTNLYRSDYGHLDLIATPEAVKEVYPYIIHWLEGRRSRQPFPMP